MDIYADSLQEYFQSGFPKLLKINGNRYTFNVKPLKTVKVRKLLSRFFVSFFYNY